MPVAPLLVAVNVTPPLTDMVFAAVKSFELPSAAKAVLVKALLPSVPPAPMFSVLPSVPVNVSVALAVSVLPLAMTSEPAGRAMLPVPVEETFSHFPLTLL